MPPARKNVIPCDVEETLSKKPRPRHVINIADLCVPNKDNDSKGHLMVNINKYSPEEISIKRSGNMLTVESKSEDKMYQGGPGAEHVVRRYKIPAGGFTEELGSQLSIDGMLSVRGPGITRTTARVIPINIDRIPQMKHGNGKFSVLTLDNAKVHYAHIQKEQINKFIERKEKVVENQLPAETEAGHGGDAPGDDPEDTILGGGLDEST